MKFRELLPAMIIWLVTIAVSFIGALYLHAGLGWLAKWPLIWLGLPIW